jgi:uncharacterized protein YchJ
MALLTFNTTAASSDFAFLSLLCIDVQKRMDLQELQIIKQEAGRSPEEAFITFKISYYDKGAKVTELSNRTEKSRFLKANSKWWFIDSDFVQA